MFIQILLIIGLCLLLIYSTNLIISAIKNISPQVGISSYGLTALFLAASTSFPELVVSVVASIEGTSSLVLGNIFGSNIANLSLVRGLGAIVGGSILIPKSIVSKDIYLAGLGAVVPILLLIDGSLSRFDGLLLIGLYIFSIIFLLNSNKQKSTKSSKITKSNKNIFAYFSTKKGILQFAQFIFGIAILLVSSHFIVKLAMELAISSGLSALFVGLFVVAVGTSLPELAFELKAIRENQASMAHGDLLGSVIANSTLILGVAVLVRPMNLPHTGLEPFTITIVTFLIVYALFTYFAFTKKRFDRWEGVALLGVYFTFILIEYLTK